MSLPRFEILHGRADFRPGPVGVAVAGGADRTLLDAYRIACDRGWASPILVGPEAEARRIAAEAGIALEGFTFLDAEAPDIARAAVAEVRAGRARVLAKGKIATPALMDVILDPEAGLRSGRVVAQVVLIELLRDARRFLLADTGVNVRPKLASRIEIMNQAIEVAHALGHPRPRVALMAASEAVSTGMPDTVESAEIARRAASGEFPAADIEGPLSFDLAYSPSAGTSKRVDGKVVGFADAMIFPDLLSANLTVKAIMYTADCLFGGVLRGTTAPVAFMSRSDDARTRLNSLALALSLLGDDVLA
ncbi:phosphate acyltransferase [Tundrisphaera sp. TA3]|uniref:phosphate acyltransferase n=1 Tax=Tundrisphaera sp. TA3 TaxID=3435775 RepID=UPI003EBD400B